MDNRNPDRARLSAKELAYHYKLSIDSLRAASSGRRPGNDLPPFEKIGGRVYYERGAVENWAMAGDRGHIKKH